MWFRSLFTFLNPYSTKTNEVARRRQIIARPRVEALEDRCLLSFSTPVSYPAGIERLFTGSNVVVGDFDGNATADVATVGGGVLLGNGDGTFHLQPDTQTDGTPLFAVAADLNNDGRLDLVGTHGIQLGNGDGTFEGHAGFVLPAQFPPGYTGIEPRPQYPSSVAAADINNDGNVDLAVTSTASYDVFAYYDEYGNPVFSPVSHGYLNVLLGNGDGTFTTLWTAQHGGSECFSAAIGDLNNDARLDLVTGNGYGAGVGVLLGNGDGTFQPGQQFGFASAQGVDLGDINGDGALDVVTIDPILPYFGGNDALVYLGNGDGTLQEARHNSAGFDLALSDLNRDGAPDFVISSGGYDEVTFFGDLHVQLSRGNGSFADFQSYPTGATDGPGFILSADFNGDGFPDVAISDYSDAANPLVKIMLNDGVWTLPPPPPPSMTITDVTLTEGHTGTRVASFTVTLSAAADQPVTVAYTTADGTATAGGDYQATSGNLTFAPGQTHMTITVLVNGDRLGEPNESFVVNLSGVNNAILTDTQGVGTILDDEPRVSISDVSKKEGKRNQSTFFTFTVTLAAAYDQPVSMSFRTADGTARTSDQDYTAKTGTMTFAPGETTKTITIEVKGDSRREGNETFYLDLFGLSSNSLFTKSRGIGTILNDD